MKLLLLFLLSVICHRNVKTCSHIRRCGQEAQSTTNVPEIIDFRSREIAIATTNITSTTKSKGTVVSSESSPTTVNLGSKFRPNKCSECHEFTNLKFIGGSAACTGKHTFKICKNATIVEEFSEFTCAEKKHCTTTRFDDPCWPGQKSACTSESEVKKPSSESTPKKRENVCNECLDFTELTGKGTKAACVGETTFSICKNGTLGSDSYMFYCPENMICSTALSSHPCRGKELEQACPKV